MFQQVEIHQRDDFYVADMIDDHGMEQKIRGYRLVIPLRRSAGHGATSYPSGARPREFTIISWRSIDFPTHF
jgi:hypothetical protein